MYVWCPLIWDSRVCNYLYTVLNLLWEKKKKNGKALLLEKGFLD